MKKVLALLLCVLMVIPFVACTAGGGGNTIGVLMPTKTLQRWIQDGDNMKSQLEKAGYKVDLQYANDDVATQVSQLENMISAGVKVLVIASIDGEALGAALVKAKEKKIPVIAYDRLIKKSDAVSYYATFDNFLVGKIQGEYIEKTLDLKNAAGPFNTELITGDPNDNNAPFFFNGAMSVLKPYIDSGKLKVVSGQTEFGQVATPGWKTENAQKRFENLLSSFYNDGTKLQCVLASNDSTAQGVTNALVKAGYTKDNFPVLTGQDCDIVSVKNMKAGLQSMSVFKDTRTLAAQVVKMVNAIMKNETVPVNDTKTYDNGAGYIVPSFLCVPVYGDVNNYKELLITSGYYTEDQLK